MPFQGPQQARRPRRAAPVYGEVQLLAADLVLELDLHQHVVLLE